MSDVRIPPFLREDFQQAKTKEERKELVESYLRWKRSEYTEKFELYLTQRLTEMLEKEESESTFRTLFESKYKSAYNKAARKTIREVIKSL